MIKYEFKLMPQFIHNSYIISDHIVTSMKLEQLSNIISEYYFI